MALQMVFKRYELKFMLTTEQKERVLRAIGPYMQPDRYGRTTIRNVYFDTDTYRLIRRSIEKPAYKEKLRIRSYEQARAHSPVFVELKKKYDGVVYKRRICLPNEDAVGWLCEHDWQHAHDSQISEEIDYFLRYYAPLRPTVFLSYEREAYCQRDGGDFRITFDNHIRFRQSDLSLEAPVGGNPILEEGKVLMELKCSGGIPLWMTAVLSSERLYKTSFSKYGTAYAAIMKGSMMYV